jgi:hypothetical protein
MPALTFATLQTELSDRGFSRLSATRLGYFINQARADLDGYRLWPYRLTTASGAAPLTIADLGTIEEVVDTANNSNPLHYMSRRNLLDYYGTITTTGTPQFFYIDNGIVRTFPIGGTLSVRYYKNAPDLTGTQVPLAPFEFHFLIVDLAEQRAHRSKGDIATANALQPYIDQQLQGMVEDQFGQQIEGGDFVQTITGSSEDW